MATHSHILAWRIPQTEVQENWDTKGAFHAHIGTIKDRNGKDLTGEEEGKNRWQECTEELYKKDLNDSDNHNGVVTFMEPNILECEVKGALGSVMGNKASGGLKSLNMMIWKCCTQYATKFGMATGLEKVSFHSNSKENQCQRMFKLPHNHSHFTS